MALKKVSTGMRVDIEDIRRGIDEILQDHNGLGREQLLVEELMDTTPTSSYEDDTWRDGYIYDARDSALISPNARAYTSDDESAEAVVTHSAAEGDAADLFVREEVPAIDAVRSKGSLLSSTLAAVRANEAAAAAAARAAAGNGKAAAAAGDHGPGRSVSFERLDSAGSGGDAAGGSSGHYGAGSGGGSGGSEELSAAMAGLELADTALAGGSLTARQLIASLLKECKARGLAVGRRSGSSDAASANANGLELRAERFELRIASDDWEPDLDFPEIDSSAAVLEVGVDQFVLCLQGGSDALMQVWLPLPPAGSGGGIGGGVGGGFPASVDVQFELPAGREKYRLRVDIGGAAGAEGKG